MAKNDHGLTPRQEKFAQGIAAGLNQSEAYRQAYPASLKWQSHSVTIAASDIAARDDVKRRIADLQEIASNEAGLTGARILEEIQKIAFSNIQGITKPDGTLKLPHELDPATAAAVASFEIDQYGGVKYKFWDKNSSLEKLAKHKGLYEQDNKQRIDPLSSMLASLGGKVIGVNAEEDEDSD